MFTNITVQILWISFASVTSYATAFYGVQEIAIFLLSAIFMIVYIPVTFLASWLIDKYDFKKGTGIGAVLVAIFGFLRFLAGSNYSLVLVFQIGIAIGQPFIMNSVTKMSNNWFPKSERTTATGLGMISMFLGIGLGLILTSFIVDAINFSAMILIYGIMALCSGTLFIIFVRNRPPTPPSTDRTIEKVFVFEGVKQLFKNKYFIILVITFVLGLGIFNMITTYIEVIVIPRGFNSIFAGILGGLMLLGGIIGCIIISQLSDKYQEKRILLIIICILIATVSLYGMTFSRDGTLLLLFGFFFGFGLLSSSPVALEYAVDITSPVPEASSNGILMMVGQASGIIFIFGFANFTNAAGDYLPALLTQSILLTALFVLTFFLKERKKKS